MTQNKKQEMLEAYIGSVVLDRDGEYGSTLKDLKEQIAWIEECASDYGVVGEITTIYVPDVGEIDFYGWREETDKEYRDRINL